MDARTLVEGLKPFLHRCEAVMHHVVRGFPLRGMRVIGVTGTDGKSTTSLMIAQMLRNSGVKVGLITTVHVDYGNGEEPSPTSQTTPSVGMLLDMFAKMKQNGVEWVVVETSSHALHQGRVWGVPYEIAVMTNVTHEHLDYHGTFEKYRDAKRRLFQQTNRNKKGLQVGLINAEDPSATLFKRDIAHPITYGVEKGDLQARDIKLTQAGSSFTAFYKGKELKIICNIPGRFNVYNSLAAIGVGGAVGLSGEQIEQGIASLTHVPGRMERIDTGKGFDVIVDYAVTAEALKNVLTTVRSTTKGKVRLVFGATGDRDKTKRPDMGKVAAGLADFVYLTDDETYTEDPQAIIDAVYKGVRKAGGEQKTQIIPDRRDAIEWALKDAEPGDTVLLTGIGHQKYRNMGGKKVEWDERDVVLALLKSA